MATSPVVTRGFGPMASIALVVTAGYASGAVIVHNLLTVGITDRLLTRETITERAAGESMLTARTARVTITESLT